MRDSPRVGHLALSPGHGHVKGRSWARSRRLGGTLELALLGVPVVPANDALQPDAELAAASRALSPASAARPLSAGLVMSLLAVGVGTLLVFSK